MRRILYLAILIALGAIPASAQNGSFTNWCQAGGLSISTSGILSSAPVQASFPKCQVSVVLTGTSTPATLYADVGGVTPLANPFCANLDGSFTFYASQGVQYDVTISNSVSCNPAASGYAQLPAPFTWFDAAVSGTGGGGGGGCGGVCVLTVFGRSGPAINAVATDYGTVGVQQSGTGTLGFTCNTGGTCTFGNSGNVFTALPLGNVSGFRALDSFGNRIESEVSGLPGLLLKTNAGTQLQLYDSGEFIAQVAGGIGTALDLLPTILNVNVPLNFAGAGFQLGGSYGLAGQCPVSTGTGQTWQNCAPTGGVTSVGVVTNQLVNTSTSTTPVLGIASPVSLPGNLFATQLANGNDLFTLTRNTDSTPTGTFIKFRNAALGTVGFIDVSGNLSFPSLTTTQSGAGYMAYAAGADNSAACTSALAAASLTGFCVEAPATIATSWTETHANAAPAAFSVPGYTAVSAGITTQSYVPTTSTAPSFIATALASAQGAANNIIPVFDGAGNIKSSGVTITAASPTCSTTTLPWPTACGGVDSLALSGNLANTNILTTTAPAGQYQLAVYMNGTTSCVTPGPGAFAAKIAYTDSNGAVTRTAGTLTFASTLPDQQPAVITFWLQSSTSTLNVSGTYTACSSGTFVLDAHYTLTRLR